MKTVAIAHLFGYNSRTYIEVTFMDTTIIPEKDSIGRHFMRVDKIYNIYSINKPAGHPNEYKEEMLIYQYDELTFYTGIGCYLFSKASSHKDGEARRRAIKLMFEVKYEDI